MTLFCDANEPFRKHKYEDAYRLYLDCLNASQPFAPVFQNLGFLFKKKGNLDAAQTAFKMADYLFNGFDGLDIKASIIIPGYKNPKAIIRLLDTLNRQNTTFFEIIVVSDGCEEVINEIKRYKSKQPLRIYNTEYKIGFGVMLARNLGVAKSLGEQLIFIDPDVIVDEYFVGRMVKNYKPHSLLIPKVNFVDENDHNQILSHENRKGFEDPNSPIRGFATQCCSISKVSFMSLGGFDMKLLGQGGSDSDFGLRHASIHNTAKYLHYIVCRHVGLSSGKKYIAGEISKWDRSIYTHRKKSGFYQDKNNAVANGGMRYFFTEDWGKFQNLHSQPFQTRCYTRPSSQRTTLPVRTHGEITKLKVATVVSNTTKFCYQKYLVPSAQFYGIELTTLLADEVKISRKTGSLSEKDRLLLAHLDGMDDDSVVMFLDGYDTVILCHQEEIIDKFKSYNAGLVVSAELNCHPDDSLAIHFPETKYSAKYLNTGGFIGYAHAIKKVIRLAQAVVVPDNPKLQLSNQYRWIRVFLENPDLLKLDNCSKLFMSGSTKKQDRSFKEFATTYSHELYKNAQFATEELDRIFSMFSVSGNRIIALESNEHPCVLHWNGPGSLLLKTHEVQFNFLRPWIRHKRTQEPV